MKILTRQFSRHLSILFGEEFLECFQKSHYPFTEILNALSINSAQLSFHIRSLIELTTQTENDKYTLSVFGKAACSLMGKVEETTKIPGKMIEFKWALIALLLVDLLPLIFG